MAQITGSSTIDWSGISLAQVDFETDIVTFINRVDQIFTELDNGQFSVISASPTFIIVNLFSSGGVLSLGGSGFDTDSPIINSFDFNNIALTGEVIRWTGTVDGIGDDFVTSATIGSTGFSETFTGTIIVPSTFPPVGNFTGTLTSLVAKIGSAKGTFSGNFSLTGDQASASLLGKVTGISVVSGTDTIKMTGLSLKISEIEAALASGDLATVNDLFAFLSDHLPGNDTITYTNNSGAGITLYGGAGNDTITVSGPNADTLIGGDGNDTYVHVAGGPSDSFIENPGEGTDTISAAVTFTLPDASQNIENLTLTGLDNIDGTGNTLNNVLTGNSGNNVLSGGDGDDQLNGGAGADTLQGEAGDDLVLLASAAQFAVGEVIDGGTQDIIGDTLRFTSTVAETLTLSANVIDVERVEIANAAGLTTGLAAINVNAAAVTSNGITLVGNNGANVLTGTAQTDTLIGNGGIDRLNGGAGDDTLNGGNGSDVIVIETAGDHGVGEMINGDAGADVIRFTSITGGEELTLSAGVTVESVVIANAAGVTTGTTALDVDASAVVSNGLTLIGNAGANTLTGTGLNDVLKGGGGDDVLDGGSGNNMLIGGTGNDSYIVNALTDVVSEGLAAGTDKVFASLTYTLGANVENLELTGSALNGTGNTLANILTGNDGNNVLTGGAGNDTLIGGLGEDTVTGGTENDRIVMLVTAGDVDIANGGVGLDTLALVGAVGGDGIAVVNLAAGAGDQVTSIGGTPDDTLVQKNFENLDASGLGSAVNATGSASANLLIGSDGNDILDGAAGNDTLDGGAGDDTLTGGDGNDIILIGAAADHGVGEVINGGAGTNVIFFSGTDGETLTLTDQVTAVEQVVIGTPPGWVAPAVVTNLNVNAAAVGNGLSLIGNAGANILTGTDFNDVLKGGGGDDTLRGGLGNDTVNGGSGNDTFLFGLGDGQDLVKDISGSADKIVFDSGINPLDLVISRHADNLRLAIHGSSDQITVQNWYTSSVNRTETIQAGNGQTLLSTQVGQLIQAMAQFTTDTGLSWDAASGGAGDPGQQAQFQGIIAANWQS